MRKVGEKESGAKRCRVKEQKVGKKVDLLNCAVVNLGKIIYLKCCSPNQDDGTRQHAKEGHTKLQTT